MARRINELHVCVIAKTFCTPASSMRTNGAFRYGAWLVPQSFGHFQGHTSALPAQKVFLYFFSLAVPRCFMSKFIVHHFPSSYHHSLAMAWSRNVIDFAIDAIFWPTYSGISTGSIAVQSYSSFPFDFSVFHIICTDPVNNATTTNSYDSFLWHHLAYAPKTCRLWWLPQATWPGNSDWIRSILQMSSCPVFWIFFQYFVGLSVPTLTCLLRHNCTGRRLSTAKSLD